MHPAAPQSARRPPRSRKSPLHSVPLVALLGALLVCGAAPAARAQTSVAQARELFLQGQKALEAGQAKEALAAFEAAYKSGNAPSLLFYLAEANRAAGNSGKAVELYQEYLAKMPNGPKKADAETHIAELKKAPKKEKEAKRKVEVDAFDLGVTAPATAAAPKKIELEGFSLDVTPKKEGAGDAKKTKAQAKAKAKAAREAKAEEQKNGPAVAGAPAPAASVPAGTGPGAVAQPATDAKTPADAKHAAGAKPAEAKSAFDPKAASALAAAAAAPAPAATVVAKADPAPGAKALPAAPEAAVAVSSAPSGRGMRTAAWVFGAVGVAALIGGGLFGLQAKGAADEVSAAARAGQTFDPSVEDRGKRAQTLQYVCLGAGGAALIGGGLLALFGPPLRSGRAELFPAPLPGGAMASLGVHY